MEMIRLKYLGHKEDGLPVTFPIGCKQKSGLTKIVWANPFIDLSIDEAAFLLKDARNWAKATPSESKGDIENVTKELAKPKSPRASVEKAAKAEAKAKRGRPKEYGQPKVGATLENPEPSGVMSEAPAPETKPKSKKKN
jgi:hypothetical protein